MTKKVYKTQKEFPTEGDFCQLVREDLRLIGIDEESLSNYSKSSFKKAAKAAINEKALAYLQDLQKAHSKVNKIKYTKMHIQPHLTSPLFSNIEARLLFKIRTGFVNCKSNFKYMCKENNMQCTLCNKHEDDQRHILECPNIRAILKSTEILSESILYEDIYSDKVRKQKAITVLFSNCIQICEKLMNNLCNIQDLTIRRSAGG